MSLDGVGKNENGITEKKGMAAPVLMIAATFLFATMSVCVKFASSEYSTGELIFYRGLVGAAMIMIFTRVRGERFVLACRLCISSGAWLVSAHLASGFIQ